MSRKPWTVLHAAMSGGVGPNNGQCHFLLCIAFYCLIISTQGFTYTDTENPVISGCPSDQSVNTDSGNATAVVTWTPPTATDNSGNQTLTSTHNPGDYFPIGNNTVTYTSTDAEGNTATCTFFVDVIDNEDPVLSGCFTSLTFNTPEGSDSVVVNWIEPTATDNSGQFNLTNTHAPGASYPIGETMVIYRAVDDSGNSDMCTIIIEIIDNEDPVLVGCLTSDIVTNTSAGLPLAMVSYSVPTATDNSGPITANLTAGSPPGNFSVGDTLVVYTATDPSGNSVSCSFYVNVTDEESPTFTSCPSNQTVGTDFRMTTATLNWTVTATDNVMVFNVTSDYDTSYVFPLGPTTVTYNAIDDYGNSAVCVFTITVEDQEAPYYSNCPSDEVNNTLTDLDYSNISWSVPQVQDNVNAAENLTGVSESHSPGSQFFAGTTIVVYQATDVAGNTGNCTFQITIIDNQAPTVTGCPSDINATTDARRSYATVNWTEPVFTDNVDIINATSTHSPLDTFSIGVTEVSYNGSDSAGNYALCTFNITAYDNENPVISRCPSDQSATTGSGNATAAATWTPPNASDNSGAQTLTSTDNPGDYFSIGNNTVTYTSRDAAGNVDTCTFYVVVTDNENPVISGCPSDQSATTGSGNATAAATWTLPAASDNSGNQTLTSTNNPGDYFAIGNNTVTYTSTDAAGNVDTCIFYVIVTDNENPVISGCPSDQSVNTDSGNATAVVTWTPPTAADNSGSETLTSTDNPGDYFSFGNTSVTYTSTDGSGNVDTCTFYVVVTDTEAPSFSGCPSNDTLQIGRNRNFRRVRWTEPTVTDNVDPTWNLTVTQNIVSDSKFFVGVTTVVYEATDLSGNIGNCSFQITIFDNQAPRVTGCPSDINATTDAGLSYATVNWTEPVFKDNVDMVNVTSTHSPLDQFSPGVTEVSYTGSDSSGNSVTCVFKVTVYDNEMPAVTGCPSDINATTDAGLSYATVNWTEPVFTDNVDINVTSTHSPLDSFNIGVTEVSYNGSDSAGNLATCVFSVTVYDNENPVISGCPSDQSVNTDSGNATAVVTWTPPTPTDNSGTQTLTSMDNPGDYFSIGNTTVTYTSTDGSGNMETCTFYVVVSDAENPMISGCPSDQSVNTDSGNATAVVTWTPPTATDNSGNQTLTSTDNPGDYFPIGNNTVTYTSTDDAGNTEICTFFVAVTDNENPVITGCFSELTSVALPGTNFDTVNWFEPMASDNSGQVNITSTHAPGAMYYIGETMVTYTAVDDSGNSDMCTFTVTISDNEDPVLTGCTTSDIVTNTSAGLPVAMVSYSIPTAMDNSGPVTANLTAGSPPGNFSIGDTFIMYTATDPSGNSVSCSFYVNVTDNENPVISGCPVDQNVGTDSGNVTAVVTWTPPTATDNSGNQTLTFTSNPGDYFSIGNTSVTYTSTDGSGNMDTCTFYVVVTDDQAPTVTGCPSDINATTESGLSYATVNWTEPVFTDNVDMVNVTSTHSPLDTFNIGVTEVSYNGSDSAGNFALCTFSITVYDQEDPSIVSCPSDVSNTTSAGIATGTAFWTEPTISDNSGSVMTGGYGRPGDAFNIGVTNILYNASDASGNENNCTFTVTITDDEAPVLNCPANITENTEIGLPVATVYWKPAIATDNSMSFNVSGDTSNPANFSIGISEVTYTSHDPYGNMATCSFFITVVDGENPVLSGCSSNITVNTSAGVAVADVSWTEPTVVENSGNYTLAQTNGAPSGSNFSIGDMVITYVAMDMAGLTDSCSFTITVLDAENPVISGCPSDQSVNTDSGNATAVVTWTPPTATDNSGNQTLTSTDNPGDYFPIGNNTVTYTSTDDAGNTEICTFLVAVTDNENPVISGCFSELTSVALPGTNFDTVNWFEPMASDNSGQVNITSTHAPGAMYYIGETIVTYTAVDDSGNSDMCTFTVTISDNEDPVLTGCATSDIVTNTSAGLPVAMVSYSVPTAMDNSGPVTANLTAGSPPGNFSIGDTFIMYTATDPSGNSVSCSFYVNVTDNENPVISGCPVDQNVGTDSGNVTAVVTWTPPTATDNSGNQTLTSTDNPGDYFSIGNTSVTYTSTDGSGNMDTCTFYVVVTDNEMPTVTGCPSDINATTDAGLSYATVNWTEPVFTDNVDMVNVTSTHSPLDTFNIGVTEVSYNGSDSAGNFALCTFSITVYDAELPTFTPCPSDITVDQDKGTNHATVTFGNITISDNDMVINSSYSHNSGDTFPIGSTQVTIYAEDASGNNNTCQFMVIVRDTENPVINCPSDITVNATAGQSNAVVSWTPPNATDNSGSYEVTFNKAVGSSFEIGSFEVIYIAVDDAGNTGRCTFFVNVEDHEDPVFSYCPTNQESFAFYNVSVEWLTPTATDNSGSIMLSSNYANGTEFAVGNYTVTYMAVDPSSNSATCTFIVQVYANDSVSPFVMCPSDIMVDTFTGLDYRNVTWGELRYSDNMEVVSVESNYVNNSSPFYIGTVVVMYNVTDRAGNTASCDFSVTVNDNEDPVLMNCPSDISQPADAGLSDTAVNWTAANATDNSGSATVTVDIPSGTRFSIGTTPVTFTAMDPYSNMATCSFNVTVTDDQVPTVISCPGDIAMGTDANVNTANVTWSPVMFSDNSGSVNVTMTYSSGDTFPLGMTNVTFTATDSSGNVAACQFSVSVFDDEAPMYISCPSDFNMSADTGSTNTTVNLTAVGFTDNVTPSQSLILNNSHPYQVVLDIGQHIINFTATDEAGLVGYCSYAVTVTDNEAPTITCPANIVNVTDPDLAVASVSWSAAVATDNTGSLNVSSDIASGSNFTVGVTTVTYTTSDPSGNPASCSFTVTISDNELPVISNCPSDINVTTDAGSDSKSNVTWSEPTATDNTGTVALTGSDNPGMSYTIGNHEVTYTAADQYGNENTCVFTIRVADLENPVFTSVPMNVTTTADSGRAGAFISPTTTTATDNSGSATISSTAPVNGFFPIGTTTVLITAVDPSGNQAEYSYVVSVTDDEAPQFDQCPGNVRMAADVRSTNATVNWTIPIFTDNSGEVNFTETYIPPAVFGLGSYIVTYNASDAAGNSVICMFTVTVVDEEAANITCPSDISVYTDPRLSIAMVNWTDAVAVDNTGPLNVTSDIPSGSNFTIGLTTVTYSTQDAAGNPASCSFVVNVTDNESPVFDVCPSNFTFTTPPGEASRVVEWMVSASDNSGWVSITSTHSINESFPVGTTQVTYQAVDAGGNSADCVFDIVVNDEESPVFLYCPRSLSQVLDPGNSTEVVTWTNPIVTDNTVNFMLSSNYDSGDAFPLGPTVVEYVAVDGYGNNATCSFTVTVGDMEDPVFVTCNMSDIMQNADAGLPNTSVSWSPPTASDNTDNVTVSGDYNPGDVFSIGTTLVTYTAVDTSGNMATCSFNVVIIDTELPVIQNCPSNLTVSTDPGSNQATNVTWTEPTATDNSGTVGFGGSKNPGDMFMFGVSTVFYTAVDAAGNEAECTFSVTVEDNEDPTFSYCPPSISAGTSPSMDTAVVWWTVPSATDNTDVASVVSDYIPGQMFPICSTLVTYNATDLGGNVAMCSFYVNVTDDEAPSVITCPSDITDSSDRGAINTTVTWTVPTFSDNAGNVTVSSNYDSPAVLDIGVWTIVYNATDLSANFAQCSFVVTVEDNEAPIITCPANIVNVTDPGLAVASVSWSAAVATDNTGSLNVSSDIASGSNFTIGVTTVTYTTSDPSGNPASCSFTVTISDTELPSISGCPSNITQSADLGSVSTNVNWTVPVFTDNAGAVSVVDSHQPLDTFYIGTTEVSLTGVDPQGNENLCIFQVTVVDTELPVFINCPSNMSVTTDFGSALADVSWPMILATDNDGTPTVATDLSGSSFPIGVHAVSYNATDDSGNVAQCTFYITVTDDQPPTYLGCPSDITVAADVGSINTTVNWTQPIAMDNVNTSGLILSSNYIPPVVLDIGSYIVNYTAVDVDGLSGECIFRVTVTDNEAPIITCPANIVNVTDPGLAVASVSWSAAVATDNTGSLNVSSDIASGSNFTIGVTTVTYTTSDTSGNPASCSFTVTITDEEKPMLLNCPSDITFNVTDSSSQANVTWPAPTISDNTDVVITVISTHPGTLFNFGDTTVVYRVQDLAGNVATCSFIVTVADMTPPMIEGCPSSINTTTDVGSPTAVVTFQSPNITDNQGTPTVLLSKQSGTEFQVGDTVVTYTATDASGNIATCSFTVTVSDNEAPVYMGCPFNVSESTAFGMASTVVNWTDPVVSDNTVAVTSTPDTPSGSSFSLGNAVVTYTAQDAYGNTATCLVYVSVYDDQPPSLQGCINNTISQPTDPSSDQAVVTWTPPTGSDNAGAPTVTSNFNPGMSFPLGISTVTYLATDGAGQTVMCSFNISIFDNEPPVFLSCPADMSGFTGNGTTSTVSWSSPRTSDNVAVVFSNQTNYPNETYPLGVTTVVLTVSDAAGNLADCSFNITVTDITRPTISGCPSNIEVEAPSNQNGSVVNWTPVTASDAFGIALENSTHTNGSYFNIGTTTVVYYFSDPNGNDATCTFDVTVIDVTRPVASECPSNTTVEPDLGSLNATVNWTEPVFSDNSGSFSLSSGPAPPSVFEPGTTLVLYQATDGSGNAGSCAFYVTVEDTIPPTLTGCPGDINVTTDAGLYTANISWSEPVASDNSIEPSLSVSQPSGSLFSITDTLVTYTATDAAGLTTQCSFTVTVRDEELPVITDCPTSINLTLPSNASTLNATWSEPTASDNSLIVMTSSTLYQYTVLNIGSSTVTYTAVDPSGNQAQCSFTLSVFDKTVPVITCPSDISVNTDPGESTAAVNWNAINATDNSGVVTVTSDIQSGTNFDVGDTVVTGTAVDGSNNEATCSFTVTVSDNEAPVFITCPSDMTLSLPASGASTRVVRWSDPIATDNTIIYTLSVNVSSGSPFSVGDTVVQYTATDMHSNTETCSFTVTITDSQLPVFTNCNTTTITQSTDANSPNATVIWSEPTASDNSASVTVTSTYSPGDSIPVGNNTVEYTAVDGSGNTATCTFFVIVEDTEAPQFPGCPAMILTAQDSGKIYATVTWQLTATDNIGVVNETSTIANGTQFSLGSTEVILEAVDAAGNRGECNFTVIVQDESAPVIRNCPGTTIAATLLNQNYTIGFWAEPTATDPGGGVTRTSNYQPLDRFYIGDTAVTYVFTDSAGNEANCTFIVEVDDTQNPVITGCPSDITVGPDQGLLTAVVNWTEPTITDNSYSVTVIQNEYSNTVFNGGTVTVVYMAVDPSGNPNTCSFTVTVTDSEAPVLSGCPSNMTSFTDSGNATALLSWTEPTATDNSIPPNVTSTAYPPSYFNIGETTVTYTATDTFQLTDTCSFTVTVIDNESPVISNCPMNVEFVVDSNSDSSNVTWTVPTASDNSGVVGLSANIDPGTVLVVGEYIVTYTATDSSGYTDSCNFTLSVLDQTPPTFYECDRTITVNTGPGLSTGFAVWNVSASDNYGNPTVVSTMPSGSNFPIGNTTVDFTATDSSNNTNTCSLYIEVLDPENPTLANCSANITANTDPNSPTAIVTWSQPAAADNSGVVSQAPDVASGSAFTVGSTTVTYTATDGSGNTAQCSFVVTVTDNQLPVFTSCNTTTIVQSTDAGQNYATVSWTLPTATDNDGTPTLNSNFNPLEQFPVGEVLVVYTASDNSGNEANCSFIVSVRDMEPPAYTNCPSDQTVTLGPSESFQAISWTPPAVSDNVMVVSNTSSVAPGSNFYFGMTVVTYYANDTAGNEMQCQFTVDVQDVTPPTLVSCPSSVTYNSSMYTSGQGPLFTTPNASDANGIQSVVASHGPYDNFTLGDTTVEYVFTDNANLTVTCTFVVTIADDESPVVDSCPSSQTLEFNSNGGSAILVNWTEPTFSDNSGNVTVVPSNGNPPIYFSLGNHTVTYTAIDSSGNSLVCSFVITVQDTIPPTLSNCSADISRVLAIGASLANVTWDAPIASDNGAVMGLVPSQSPPAPFSIGVTTVTYTARDYAGLTSTCSFNVTIIDLETPVLFNCPTNVTVEVGASESTSNVSWTEPTATDNSGNVGLQPSHPPYSIFSIGSTNVTYTATDGSGNVDTCSFDVIVLDNVNPVLKCSSSFSLTTDVGQATASNISAVVSATDNSGTPLLTSNLPGDEAGVGVTMVTVTATDGSGNMATCEFNITVSDLEGPTYTPCPSDLYLNTTNVASWTIPVPSDNTGVIASSVFSHEPGVFPSGTTVVSYNATDQYGNQGTCQFTVTVDATGSPMVSNCPSDITVNSSVATYSANVTWSEPSATDSDAVNKTQTHYSGDSFPIGVTEVTYLFTDTTGRSTSCVFDVTVILKADTVPPVFDFCPSNFTTYTAVGSTNATVTWSEPVASDATRLPVTLTSNYVSGDIYGVGIYTVLYTALDTFNNTASCEFTFELIEDFAPVFENCTSDISQNTDPGAPNATVTWTEPVGSDANGAVTTSSNYSPGEIFPIGPAVVNYEVTDGTNNTASCTFTITISDGEKPTFTSCPSTVTVYVQSNATSGNVTWTEPTAEDNVGVVSLVGTFSQGTFDVGTYSVVYSAQDANGNEELCIFTVEVIQDQSPTFVTCPNDITQATDAGVNNAMVTWTEPTVTDDRDNATISTPNYSSGDTFPLGSTTVMYTATDRSGNTATCSFTVHVDDEENPVIVNCPSAITEYTPASTTVIVSWTEPTATDNDNVASLTSNIQSGTPFVVGVSDVIYTAVDDSSNTESCTFRITILEDMPPTISNCPSDISQNTDFNSSTAVVTWTEPSTTDDLGSANLTSDVASGSPFSIGTTTVTFTATDSASQTSTCTFDVVISDQEKPVLTNCPTAVSAIISPNEVNTPVTWTPPSATDNSGSVTVTANVNPGDLLGVGIEVVIYLAIDGSGNNDVCTFIITVTEDQPPVVSDCPSDQSVNTDAGQNYATITWTEPTATDDTGNVTVSISPSSTQYPVGTTPVTYTFTDAVNLTSTCSFSVTVQDTEDPVFSNCPSQINELLPTSQLPVTVNWTAPTVTDNTGNVSISVNIESGTSFPEGTHQISYTATDDYGNTDVCIFDIVVTVDQPPTFTFCPSAITTPTDAGVDYTSVTWTQATATDDNGNVTLTSNYQSGDNFTTGSTTVTVTATDSAGSSSTCTFDVTVNDEENPVLVNCPSDITAYVFNSSESAIITWTEPSVTDNSGETITPNSNMAPGGSFSSGSVTVLYSATDSSQNIDTCSFVIIVQVATSVSQYEANLKLNRIRDQVGPYSSGDVTASESKLRDDLETLFRQSTVSTYHAGVVIVSSAVDPSSDLSADFVLTLYFKTDASVTEAAIESAFDGSLTNDKFDINNGVAQADDFYITPGPCSAAPCQNSGTCTALNRVNFECTCTSAWTGTLCTTDVNECDTSPCGANQDCFNTDGGFNCQCTEGFANVNSACVKVAQSFGGSFDIEMIDGQTAVFSSDLNDQTSSAFTALEPRVTYALDGIYSGTQGYLGSEVVSFSSGSIKVEYELLFETSVDSTSLSSMLNKSISDSTGEISQTAIIVKTSSVTTVQELCPENYCENNGICVITVGLQRQCVCEANFEGDQCEINLNSIPTYIIVLIVAAGLLVIIVLVLLALCFFIMKTSNDKDAGNFIYSVEGGQENFTFGHTRDDMLHMRGPSRANTDHTISRPSDPDRAELRTTREDERRDRAYGHHHRHHASRHRKYGERFYHDTPPPSYHGTGVEVGREARGDCVIPRPLTHEVSSASRPDDMVIHQLYNSGPDMDPARIVYGHRNVENEAGYF